MITEKDIPEVYRMAKEMHAKLTNSVRRRSDWPLLARKCYKLMVLCNHVAPKPLLAIEQNMLEIMKLMNKPAAR